MKIVLPVHHFPPKHSAGAELYTFRLARRLQQLGHEVAVATIDAIDQGAPDRIETVSDSYEGVAVERLSFNLIAAPERRRWDYDNDLLGAWFDSYLARERPDLVHFQAGYLLGVAPIFAAARAAIPSILTLHDYWLLCPRHTLQRSDGTLCHTVPEPAVCAWCRTAEARPYRLADQLSGGLAGKLAQQIALAPQTAQIASRRTRIAAAVQQLDLLIAPSQFLARQIASVAPTERMVVLGYGLDLAPFAGVTHPPSAALRIGYVGQIAHHKGVHLLIAAFRALRPGARPIELHLHGGLEANPGYVTELRQLAAGDERIVFHGRFENRRAPAILAGFDVSVAPSVWFENSPLAIMEAHAAGTPVVTARLGGMAELVRHELDGLHFAPNDPADLTRQLQRTLDEPELLPQLRSGVRPPQSIDSEIAQLLEHYARLAQPVTSH